MIARLTRAACVLLLGMWCPTLAVADTAQYIYDDLGRLSQVIDGQGNMATRMNTSDHVNLGSAWLPGVRGGR